MVWRGVQSGVCVEWSACGGVVCVGIGADWSAWGAEWSAWSEVSVWSAERSVWSGVGGARSGVECVWSGVCRERSGASTWNAVCGVECSVWRGVRGMD